MSCVTSTFCVASDEQEDASTWRGSAWSAPEPVSIIQSGPAYVSCASTTWCIGVAASQGAQYDGSSWDWGKWLLSEIHDTVVGVSCTSSTFCAVADSRSAVRYTGSGWTQPTILGYTADPSSDTYNASSVSCGTPTFCQVGFYRGDNVFGSPGGSTWNGASWTMGYWGGIESFAPPVRMSCVGATFCLSVGGTYFGTYSGSSWHSHDVQPSSENLLTVSCTSSTFCLSTDARGRWLKYIGSSWTTPATIGITPTALSCAAPTFCVAVDGSGRRAVFNGSGWSSPLSIDTQALTSVSCTSISFCVAVDRAGRATQFNGSTWTAPTVIDSGALLVGVSCVGSTFCVAVDAAGYAVKGAG